ncbi:MAG: YraN family protein [Mangrovicoccus sp.]|nr:YraN family protein [Mangrovicoccus sp.]
MSGALGFHSGLAAEAIAEQAYLGQGHEVLARRWRGAGGEIDLIARRDNVLRFIEVKKARSHAQAAERVTARQQARIICAAQEYLGQCPDGLDSDMQFDVALVDGAGRLHILESVFH